MFTELGRRFCTIVRIAFLAQYITQEVDCNVMIKYYTSYKYILFMLKCKCLRFTGAKDVPFNKDAGTMKILLNGLLLWIIFCCSWALNGKSKW